MRREFQNTKFEFFPAGQRRPRLMLSAAHNRYTPIFRLQLQTRVLSVPVFTAITTQPPLTSPGPRTKKKTTHTHTFLHVFYSTTPAATPPFIRSVQLVFHIASSSLKRYITRARARTHTSQFTRRRAFTWINARCP